MAKRISDRTRLIHWALSLSLSELDAILETLLAIKNSRFPKEKKQRKVKTPPAPERS